MKKCHPLQAFKADISLSHKEITFDVSNQTPCNSFIQFLIGVIHSSRKATRECEDFGVLVFLSLLSVQLLAHIYLSLFSLSS